jgi:SAM-dependent methyltransferase
MLLLNIGCGDCRILTPEWMNVDDLFNHFPEGNPERGYLIDRLRAEPNYINMDIAAKWWPGQHPGETENRFDGCTLNHVAEHFDVPGALHIFREIHRCLKPGGVLRVTVPNASYFREVYPEDRRENWVRLFEDVNDVSENTTYLQVALFFSQHLQCYSEDTLWCQLVMAGFAPDRVSRVEPGQSGTGNPAGQALTVMDTRPRFSLHMEAVKA